MNAFKSSFYPTETNLFSSFFLSKEGFHVLDGHSISTELNVEHEKLPQFQEYWNSLEVDPYMADGGLYRQRRFGYFHYDPNFGLEYKGNKAFYQKLSHNRLNGGIARTFSQLEDSFQRSNFLHSLIMYDILFKGRMCQAVRVLFTTLRRHLSTAIRLQSH